MTTQLNPRRLAALSGVAFVVLDIAGGVIHGSPPSLNASAARITSFFRHHHTAVLVSLVMAAVGFMLLIVVASVLASELRDSGRRVAAGTLLAAFAGAVAVAILSGGIEVGVAQTAVAPATDPGFVRGAYGLASSLNPAPCLFIALAAASVVFGGRGVLPMWFAWLSVVVGVLNVLGGVSVGTSGFFASNDGGAIVLAGIALSVWVLAAGWVFWRRPQVEVVAPAPTADVPASI